ncbi:MAG: DUF4352 domain-containing protein [Actinomycetota bacterium]|nr:DUF4352 domain-containing protein [Actinomycetota bacterium]
MRRAAGWLAAGGLVIVASVAVATAPQSGTIADPFVRTGEVGDVVHARKFDVEVVGVRLAEELDLDYDDTTLATDGLWIVVDVIVTSNLDAVQLVYSEVRIAGVGYRTTALPYPSVDFTTFGAGIPVRGSLVFEVPKDAVSGVGADTARVRFQTGISVQLDDVPEVFVDLASLDVERSAIIDEAFVLGVP